MLGGLTLELVLQHREIGGAVGGRHDDLAVDDRRGRLDVPGVVGDLLEAVGPVVAAPGEDLDRLVGQVDLDPVAVELDFVDPARSGRHLVDRGRQGRLDEAGQRRLDADRPRFSYAETPLDELHATRQPIQIGTARIRSGTGESLWRCFAAPSQQEDADGGSEEKKTARGRKQDRARVAGGQEYEVSYESKKTGRSARGREEGRQEGRQRPQEGREAPGR